MKKTNTFSMLNLKNTLALLGFGFFLLAFSSNTLYGQCNAEGPGPWGIPSQTGDGRYEFEISPTSSYNLMGTQFCTGDQQGGMACCTPPPSTRCVDLIFKVVAPAGQSFDDACSGSMMVMTAQGNFSSAYLSINGSDPAGGAVDCASGIDIGNNHTIKALFNGLANGDMTITLQIFDKDNVKIGELAQTITPSPTPSYAIITICKPGFGCVEDEFVFGCCSATASVALDAGSPDEICEGENTTLKFSADQGTPPYTVSYLASDGVNMTNSSIVVGTNGGPVMDMETLVVSPSVTTTYTVLSVEDATGCAQPPGPNDQVTVTVHPRPAAQNVTGGGSYCTGGNGVAIGLDGSESGINYQLKRAPNTDVGAPLGGTDAALNFGNQTIAGTYFVVATNPATTCTRTMSGTKDVTIDPLPQMTCPPNLSVCVDDLSLELNVLGAAPTPGTFSGPGVNGTKFSAAAGTQNVLSYSHTDVNGCSNSCNFTISVYAQPSPFNLTGGGNYCAGGTGVPVGLAGSQVGVLYQLKNNGNPVGAPVPGNGGSINFGLQTLAGTYTVTATLANPPFCSADMPNSVNVVVNAVPTIYDVVGGGAYCKDGDGKEVGLSDSENGMVYQLQLNNANTGAPVNGTGFPISFGKQTAAGTYTVVASNSLNASCTAAMNGSVDVSIIDLIMTDAITHSPIYCMDDPGPVIGLDGSKVGVTYQLQRPGGMNVGAPVAGTGAPIYFGVYPNGYYMVVATNGMGCTATVPGFVNAQASVCDIDAPDICDCDDGVRGNVTVKVNAPSGQTWTVIEVIGLYGTSNPYPQIMPGAVLTDIGGDMHTLETTRLADKGFFIKVSNGFSELNIAAGVPSW